MRRLATLIGVAGLVAAFTLAFGIGPTSAFHLSPPQESDHALMDAVAGEKVYCGVATLVEPWTLHVSAWPGDSDGKLRIVFNDDDSIDFAMPADTSFSLTQSMGGVPTVDDLVKIEIVDGGASRVAMVSALARRGSLDPFDETDTGVAEKDNLCLTCTSGGGDPGCTSAKVAIAF